MFSPQSRGGSSSSKRGGYRGFFRGGTLENAEEEADDDDVVLKRVLLKKDVCSVAVIAGRAFHERANLKTRVRCALLAPGLVDSVAITDGAFGTDPVFRAEIHLPLTLNVNTYTHLSVELLDEEMTKVVGFGTMDFQLFANENKGKVPGKWIAMWDDLRENIVGHVCVRVTLEGVNFGKEKARNLVANKNVHPDGEKTPEKQSSGGGGGVFEIGKHQISEGRKQLLDRFSRTPPQFKKPEEVTREAQETVTLKSKELEEEKKRREALEKQLEEMKRAQKEREKRERVTGGVMNPISTGATVSEIAHDFENLNKNFSYNNNNSRETINRTREEEEEERSMDTNARSQRSFLLDTSKVSVGPPLSPVRSSMNTSVANRSFRDEQTNQQQQTKEQALRSLRQRGILTDISMQARERASRNFIRKPIGLVSRIADRSRRTVLKKFTTLRSIVQTIDPNVLVGAAIGLFLVGFRSSRSADERDLRFVSIEDVDVSEQHQKLEQQQQQSGNNIDYFYPDDPRGPLRRGEYEVKPGDSLCAATGCVLPEKVEVRDANGNLVKYPDVIYPGDRITLFH